jgi:hypothetical protein
MGDANGEYMDNVTSSGFFISPSGTYLSTQSIGGSAIGNIWRMVVGTDFGITSSGTVYTNDCYISGGEISNCAISNCTIDNTNLVDYANSAGYATSAGSAGTAVSASSATTASYAQDAGRVYTYGIGDSKHCYFETNAFGLNIKKQD